MMITIYLGNDPYGYQGMHLLLVNLRVGKLVDQGFDQGENSFTHGSVCFYKVFVLLRCHAYVFDWI